MKRYFLRPYQPDERAELNSRGDLRWRKHPFRRNAVVSNRGHVVIFVAGSRDQFLKDAKVVRRNFNESE